MVASAHYDNSLVHSYIRGNSMVTLHFGSTVSLNVLSIISFSLLYQDLTSHI